MNRENYPSVTQVINFFASRPQVSERVKQNMLNGMERGTEVHKASAAISRGIWTPRLSDERQGYVESFRQWKITYVKRVFLVEQRLYDDKHQISGKPDLTCELVDGPDPVLVDYKTGGRSRLWEVQTATYIHLINISKLLIPLKVKRAIVLILDKDGGEAHVPPGFEATAYHLAIFLAMKTTYQFLTQGVKGGEKE
jgi:hypothetical protein